MEQNREKVGSNHIKLLTNNSGFHWTVVRVTFFFILFLKFVLDYFSLICTDS